MPIKPIILIITAIIIFSYLGFLGIEEITNLPKRIDCLLTNENEASLSCKTPTIWNYYQNAPPAHLKAYISALSKIIISFIIILASLLVLFFTKIRIKKPS